MNENFSNTIMPFEKQHLSEEDIQSILRDAIENAIAFNNAELLQTRSKAERYFNGECDLFAEEGRSNFVATKLSDAYKVILPSLLRIFFSSEKPVEYVPLNNDDVKMAAEATKYAHQQFNKLNGYSVLSSAIQDSLLMKVGIVKVFWDESKENKIYRYSNLNEYEMYLLKQDGEVSVIEEEEIDTDSDIGIFNCIINRQLKKGKLGLVSIPPEDFFIDSEASSLQDAYVVGQQTVMRVGDVIAMGFDIDTIEEIYKHANTDKGNTLGRKNIYDIKGTSYESYQDNTLDLSMRSILITEVYMRMDIEGKGIPILYRFICAGDNYDILDYTPWGELPFAIFQIDPIAHCFYGKSLSDVLMQDQDTATALIRSVIDNVAITNNPRVAIIDGQVNINDVLNNEIGGIVRTKTPGAIQELSTPFIAGQTLGALQYVDNITEWKTGITKASLGLDPNALKTSTVIASDLTAQKGAGALEAMARNLAEGGMKELFRLILHLIVENIEDEVVLRDNDNQFFKIDPRTWKTDLDISVTVGLGTGNQAQKFSMLQEIFKIQNDVLNSKGPDNGMVTTNHVKNTLSDMLKSAGIYNVNRYFMPMEQEEEIQQNQLEAQQMQQMMQPQQDPIVEAEMIRAQSASDMAKMKMEIEAQKAIADDDRKRDKMDSDIIFKVLDLLGKYGISVNPEEILAHQAKPRYEEAIPSQALTESRF